ncbi:hypothetical protein CTAM01_01970 [Colletotrichum tamarilloi]|uniref:Uncharacterized protein n=1 Tax=Colletotrichum tamarilloi TaxID=1209934 RepID=A0ABQ9RQ29_9PEZI|nr:uncharacterized protein CTAM01_01970 [Colletotrichum tamarilloi]KAI3541855.1 hypothetical protein CSPX01_07363 [Colletotrichum filicis]KAK1509847.1 hypothetical protein CTAM01_01970 [Colletotrichum tamarilloi]
MDLAWARCRNPLPSPESQTFVFPTTAMAHWELWTPAPTLFPGHGHGFLSPAQSRHLCWHYQSSQCHSLSCAQSVPSGHATLDVMRWLHERSPRDQCWARPANTTDSDELPSGAPNSRRVLDLIIASLVVKSAQRNSHPGGLQPGCQGAVAIVVLLEAQADPPCKLPLVRCGWLVGDAAVHVTNHQVSIRRGAWLPDLRPFCWGNAKPNSVNLLFIVSKFFFLPFP